MKTSPSGIALIKHYEDFRSEPYVCAGGKFTIGWGHTKGVTKDTQPITILQGNLLLGIDLEEFEDAVNSLVKVPLLQCEFDAIVSLTYNIGAGALSKSTLLRKLNSGDKQGAAMQFPRWNKAGGKELAGLTRRRNAEFALFVGNKVVL